MDSYCIDRYKWYTDNGLQDVQNKRRGRYIWDMVIALVKRRTIVMYWIGLTAETGCAEHGHTRAQDKQCFEVEFN